MCDSRLPRTPVAGRVYTLRFSNADGSPDLQTQYDFETKPGHSGCWVRRARLSDIASDEWKLHFFGSLTAESAQPEADPDHDGVPNWAEYLAGTDPTDAQSHLHLQVAPSAARLPGWS